MKRFIVTKLTTKKVILIVVGIIIISFVCGFFTNQILEFFFPGIGSTLSKALVSVSSGAYASFIMRS